MPDETTSARVYRTTMIRYRAWARITGRSITELMDIALLFALRKQSEVEREITQKLEVKS